LELPQNIVRLTRVGGLGLIGNIYIYIYGIFLYINSRSFVGFCVIWALGGSNIGKKKGGRVTKIVPARQTHFGEFFGQSFGEITFSINNNAPNKSVILM